MSENNKVYLLKKHEFLMLAAVAGIRSIYGFQLAGDSLEREESIQILLDLTQKHYVRVEGERFVLINDMKMIMDQIQNVETTMDVHKSSGRSCILYIQDKAVKVTESMRRKDVLEVMLMPKSDIWKHLQEEGWVADDADVIGEVL